MWEFESSQVELAVQLTKFSALAAGVGTDAGHCGVADVDKSADGDQSFART